MMTICLASGATSPAQNIVSQIVCILETICHCLLPSLEALVEISVMRRALVVILATAAANCGGSVSTTSRCGDEICTGSQVCVANRCRQPCVNSSQCSPPETACRNGACVESPCGNGVIDKDVSPAEFCDNGAANVVCSMPNGRFAQICEMPTFQSICNTSVVISSPN